MRTIKSYLDVPADCRGATTVIGNFDGVHLGHQSVIHRARSIADETQTPLGVITFEPHPRRFFAPGSDPFRLMNSRARSMKIASCGVNMLFEMTFDRSMASLTPEAFTRLVLHNGIGTSHVIVGKDFRYGQRRAGRVDTLLHDCRTLGIDVTVAPDEAHDGAKVSSTAIRDAISRGDTRMAASLLGHNHEIVGTVIEGDRRGRTLGFPTANIALDDILAPLAGVYAVNVTIEPDSSQDVLPGVASIGVKPTFGTHAPNLEVYIFDFADVLYGKLMVVELVGFLRPEIRYENVEDLIGQMHRDCEDARVVLAGTD